MHGGQNYSLEQSQVASASKPRYHTLHRWREKNVTIHLVLAVDSHTLIPH